MRKWILATALMVAAPTLGAAAVVYAPAQAEQLVEGHTVFTVITVRNGTVEQKEEFAAAVAVLVREQIRKIDYEDRFPGVLWFNDQYLVNPEQNVPVDTAVSETRYPCGAVIAVNEGDALPKVNGTPIVPATAQYVESYRVTDPNDATWEVDKWSYDPDANASTANSFLVWSVPTRDSSATNYTSGDDGRWKCSALSDHKMGCGLPLLPFTDETPQDPQPRPPGYPASQPWPQRRSDVYEDDEAEEGRKECLGDRVGVDSLNQYPLANRPTANGRLGTEGYNAVLFFFLQDLTRPGALKDHKTADAGDASRCQVGYSAWPCPGEDDDKEGNSHPYNPKRPWPLQLSEGRDNHGGSKGCGAGEIGGGPQYQHATCDVDVYFGYVAAPLPLPTERVWRVNDVEGRTSPYHCHPSITTPQLSGPCNEEEVAPGTL